MNTNNARIAKHIIILTIAISLTACGGGGGGSNVAVPDNSAAINAALQNIASTLPVTAPFTGAFTLVDGVAMGYVEGTSEKDVATKLANMIISSPTTYPNQNKLMLSDAGLKITIAGKITGTSALGLVTSLPDTVYTATIRNDGLHLS